MKAFKSFFSIFLTTGLLSTWSLSNAGGQDYSGNEDPNKKILKQGLLGAGVGAISSSASGGNAGQGALIGAGTNVIGGALLDTITSSPAPRQQPQPVQYVQSAPSYSQTSYPVQPQQQQQMVYQEPPQPVYYQQAPPQEDPTKKILKQGLLGAGVGAISSSASGGDAGKGALIGAGTNVIGGALLLLAAAVVGKLAGVALAGRILGWPKGEAGVIGWLLQTKALIMIIFANILLDRQIISPESFTALLLMAIASTMLSIPLAAPKLRLLMADPGVARDSAEANRHR